MPQNEPQIQRTTQSTTAGQPSAGFAEASQKGLKDVAKLQSQFSDYLQEANRTWLAHMQSEASLASQLASELAAARTLPETTVAWQHWAKGRIELFTEESKRLLAQTEKLMESGGRMLGNGSSPHL
jgi:hypothetical protein